MQHKTKLMEETRTMSTQIEFFFDPASTYSYLAATQIEAFAKQHATTVVWKPFLLGKAFEATGNKMPALIPAKGKYLFKDASLWAKLYGVPFVFPKNFPLNSVLASRATIAADQAGQGVPFALAMFKAYWAEGADLSQPDAIAAVANGVGLDGTALVAATGEAAVKDVLRANTEDAIARGVFGAPTFFIGKQMFWGNDRLPLMSAFLKGELA